jgi:cation:H+ antiporter
MLLVVLLFFLGLFLLIKGADIFVKSAASIAKKMGVSELIIGLTLVAVGTSIPELASALTSSLEGQNDLLTGNIVGSNISNIGLIMGLAAVASRVKVSPQVVSRDGYVLLFASIMFYVSMLNRQITSREGVLFLVLYACYLLFLFKGNSRADGTYRFREFLRYFFGFKYLMTIKDGLGNGLLKVVNGTKSVSELKVRRLFQEALLKDLLLIVIGVAAVILGAKYFIEGAVYLAEAFSLPKTLVGVLLAVGTTMPELGVSYIAARKGYGDIAVGNIIGSNITNILLILGVCSTISPIIISSLVAEYTAPYLLFITIIFLIFLMTRKEIRRKEGVVLFSLYLVFILFLVIRSLHLL